MGRRAASGGVEIRDSSIRITFTLNGKHFKETLRANGRSLPPTPANIRFAQKTSATINTRIAAGVFSFAEFFPDSKHAAKVRPSTFAALAAQWLASKGNLQPATQAQYRSAVNLWNKLLGRDTSVQALTHGALASAVGSHPWPSAKSANNSLVVLRGIMAMHYHGPIAAQNPMQGIDNLPRVRKRPDPLTAAERDAILADMRKRYDPRIGAYFTFAFFTGMRPEEIIALQWLDFDPERAVMSVRRVRTFKGSERDGSKTHTERDVDLLPQAVEALTLLEPHTAPSGDVFQNPVTGRPWHDERSQRDHYWKPTLKRLGIRPRRAYCTRHTFATVALMGGVNPAYVAAQMGHSSTKMFFETYSRWIAEADNGLQRSIMTTAFSQDFPSDSEVQSKPLNINENLGRRDWTRNKPEGQ